MFGSETKSLAWGTLEHGNPLREGKVDGKDEQNKVDGPQFNRAPKPSKCGLPSSHGGRGICSKSPMDMSYVCLCLIFLGFFF